MLQILDTGIDTAENNMRFDENLLERLTPSSDPILHLYQWKPIAATFGYFIKPENHLDLKNCEKLGLDLARRPTGGGIVFHIWDLAFSFLMPSGHPACSLNTLENYRFVNDAVLDAVKDYFKLTPELIAQDAASLGPDCKNFCMARPTQYDVVYEGMKIAGSAQRRKSQGYLHQGTISLAAPDGGLLRQMLSSKEEVAGAMETFTFSRVGDSKELTKVRKDLEKLLADKLQVALNLSP